MLDFFLDVVDKRQSVRIMKSSIRNVSEIIEISESRHTPDKMAYQHIIQQGDKLIRSRAMEQQTDAIFEVPAMILFKPIYDRDELTRRIHKHYKKIGFTCRLEKYVITLSWGKKEEQNKKHEEDQDEDQEESDESYESDISEEETQEKKIILDKSSKLSQRVSEI